MQAMTCRDALIPRSAWMRESGDPHGSATVLASLDIDPEVEQCRHRIRKVLDDTLDMLFLTTRQNCDDSSAIHAEGNLDANLQRRSTFPAP